MIVDFFFVWCNQAIISAISIGIPNVICLKKKLNNIATLHAANTNNTISHIPGHLFTFTRELILIKVFFRKNLF